MTITPFRRRASGCVSRRCRGLLRADWRESGRCAHASVRHADVRLLNADGTTVDLSSDLPNPYRVAAPRVLAPAGGSAIIVSQVIPDAYGQALANIAGPSGRSLAISVQVVATLADGSTAVSATRAFPLDLCVGCLHRCMTDGSGAPIHAPSCLPGQDVVSDVCF